MANTVFLNPGHGGSDPGTVANGFKEKDLNLKISLACRDELKRHNVTVIMGRDKDIDRTSSEVIDICNTSGAQLAVDIHNNAGKGDGAEVFCYSGGGTSKTLADNILAEIVKLGQNSRGIKTRVNSDGSEYYYFIRETSMPAVIVECAFVDNREDIKILDSDAKLQSMGKAIAKGILKVLGIAYKSETAKDNVKVDLEVAGLQALLRQAYAQGIVNTFVKPIDNKTGKLTNAAILEAKAALGVKNPDYTITLDFIADLEHLVNVTREANFDKARKDVNQDGRVNVRDATALQKEIAGIED